MKAFLFTLVAVMAGIWVFNFARKKKAPALSEDDRKRLQTLYGPGGLGLPEVDPITGDYLMASARPGTVSFSAQDN